MRIRFIFMIGIFLWPLIIKAESKSPEFEKFFVDKTMRIDYFHVGDADTEIITLDQVYVYDVWAGSLNNLIDRSNNGRYCVNIYDSDSAQPVYSQGFDSYFGEYRTSSPAASGIKRTYHESALIPCPKGKIEFSIEKRDRENVLREIFRCEIDPDDIGIIIEPIHDPAVEVIKEHSGGSPHEKVDIAIIGEGYTINEIGKFKEDLKRMTAIFFKYEPFKSLKDKFNIYGVLKPSLDSGTDEPRAKINKRTALNSSFNAMGSERYLLTEDNKQLRNIAAHIPYDTPIIMVNHKRYGGGGIYNSFCTFTVDTQFHEYIFIHEFGHSFGGLADEYYTSSVAYNGMYPKGVEPLEANITALLAPERLKWQDFVDKDVVIPTPWEKADFDTMDSAWQAERHRMNERIAEMKRTGAQPPDLVRAEQEYARKDLEHSQKVDRYLKNSRYWGKVGVFEGAGYSSHGLYRPMIDCIMFTKGKKPFCTVCKEALRKMIERLTE